MRITEATIRALRREAANVGDFAQVYLCDLALGQDVHPADFALGNDEIRTLTTDPAQAWRDCEAVLRYAQACAAAGQ